MEYLIALVALTAMEIVLGIDNIVFIAILTSRLPIDQQPKARRLGLALALIARILLLLSISWILKLTDPILHLSSLSLPPSWLNEEIDAISIKDLILFFGGLFLIWKSVHEIHNKLEGEADGHHVGERVSFRGVLIQIALMDIIFSLDSVITAVGMVKGDDYWAKIGVMVTAVMIAIGVMLIFAEQISRFVQHNPTLKMLALSFLILIGVMLVAEGIGTHFDKGYIYFAMVFALGVEFLNLRMKKKTTDRQLIAE
jgi:predicted tellurium resistance membrane protein TerC